MTNTEPSSIKVNDNKAGMDNLDKIKINDIILDASKGSKFYDNEVKKEGLLKKQIASLLLNYKKLTEHDINTGEIKADKLVKEINDNRSLNSSIIHIDMDAYFAAVEILDDPTLRRKPMAVGSESMLSTSNYEARKFGVRAAMPGFIAKKLCPDLILIEPNFEKYTRISRIFRKIFSEYDENFTALGLDEACLDITDHLMKRVSFTPDQMTYEAQFTCECSPPEPIATRHTRLFHVCSACGLLIGSKSRRFTFSVWGACEEIRFRVLCATGLTSSAGIAANSLLAKITSDINKPNGQYHLMSTEQEIENFMRELPIRKVPGIGKVSEFKLAALGITKCGDFLEKRGALFHLFKMSSFCYFLKIGLGDAGASFMDMDCEEHESSADRKSMSVERTFMDCEDVDKLLSKCRGLCASLHEDMVEARVKGKCISIKLKLSTFELRTRAVTIVDYTNSLDTLIEYACGLLQTEINNYQPHNLCLRLLGVRISALAPVTAVTQNTKQLSILDAFKTRIGKEDNVTDYVSRSAGGSGQSVRCPICRMETPSISINDHLDACLIKCQSDQGAASTSAGPSLGLSLKRKGNLVGESSKKIFRGPLDNYLKRK